MTASVVGWAATLPCIQIQEELSNQETKRRDGRMTARVFANRTQQSHLKEALVVISLSAKVAQGYA